MTDYTKLIERAEPFMQGLGKAILREIAASFEALQAENERLKRDVACHDDMSNEIAYLRKECEALQRSGAPVAYSVGNTLKWHEGKGMTNAQLFAAPKALEPLTDEQIAESILAADRAQWLADNFDSSHEHYNEALDKLRAYAKLIRDLLAAHGITKGTPT